MQNIKLTDKELNTLKTKHQLKGAEGSEGKIYLYNDNGQKVAIKLFTTTNLNILENKEKKIILLNKTPLNENILKPLKTVSNNDQIIGYTQELVWPHQSFFDVKFFTSSKTKLEYLRQGKVLIEDLHNNGIIHSDIRSFNILTENHTVKICDIDNCIIGDLSYDMQGCFVDLYKKQRGTVDELIDVFCYNTVTIALLKRLIDVYAYNYIKNSCSLNRSIQKIYKEMTCLNENYSGEYLIDTLDRKTKIKLL